MFGDITVAIDSTQCVAIGLDKPDAAVGMRCHGAWLTVMAWDRKLGDVTINGNPADAVTRGSGVTGFSTASRY